MSFPSYVNVLYNVTDIMVLTLALGYTVAFNILQIWEEGNYYRVMISMVLLLSFGFRCITHLRLFDGIRYLVGMIVHSVIDTRFFMMIFGLLCFVFSCVLVQIDKQANPNPDLSFGTFLKALDAYYNYGFGIWGASGDLDVTHYTMFVISSLLISLIMFNLLIAIIGDTQGDYVSNKDLYDTKEVIEILYNWNRFLTTFYFSNRLDRDLSYIHFVLHSDGQ